MLRVHGTSAQLPEWQIRANAELRIAFESATNPAICAAIASTTLQVLAGVPQFWAITLIAILCSASITNMVNSMLVRRYGTSHCVTLIWVTRVLIAAAMPIVAVWAWRGPTYAVLSVVTGAMCAIVFTALSRARSVLRVIDTIQNNQQA